MRLLVYIISLERWQYKNTPITHSANLVRCHVRRTLRLVSSIDRSAAELGPLRSQSLLSLAVSTSSPIVTHCVPRELLIVRSDPWCD